MNIVDIVIIGVLIIGMFLGFIRGFFKQTVMFVGTILTVILAFVFKNPLSLMMYKNLPFFKFGGLFSGLTSLNILMYEALAFIIALVIMSIVLAVIIKLTGVIEKVLKMTIILAVPSKLLGMAVGLIQSFVVIYISLFIASLPIMNVPYLEDSKYTKLILNNTPFLSSITDGMTDTYEEITEFVNENKDTSIDAKTKNKNIVEIMLKNKVTTTESIKLLIDKGKLDIDNIDELLNKYKEE